MEISEWTDYDRIAFALISPLCQDLIKNPKEETLLKLQSLIDAMPVETVQMYQRYILVPLTVVLIKKEMRFSTKQQVVDCLAKTIGKTKVAGIDQFMKIFSEAFRTISDSSLQRIVPDAPEELKISVMKCVTVLISNSLQEVLSNFYCEKNIPLISHGIYFCLSIVKEETFLDLRLAALECLMHVCQVHGEVNCTRKGPRVKIGHILMFCLPGIILNLRKVINPDEKQNHKLLMMALRAWSRITSSVMEDDASGVTETVCDDWITAKNDLMSFMDKMKLDVVKNVDKNAIINSLKGKERTKEWLTNASRSMYQIVHEICIMNFSNWKVRLEMVNSAELLLSCSRNMKECVPPLVGLLLTLSEDEIADVSEKSKMVLHKFSEKFEKSHSLTLMEMMEDHFLKVAHRLSNSVQGEAELKMNLNLMCGYLRLLGPHVQRIIRSSAHLNAMSSALLKIIALDYFVVSPLEDWSLGTSDSDILKASIPWKCFKLFKDPLIFGKFKEICRLIGQNGDPLFLSSHFLNLFYQDYENQKEITLIINEVFSSAELFDEENVAVVIKRIIESYLDPEVWNTQIIEDPYRNGNVKYLSVTDNRSRNVQSCLLVEGLGMLSHVTMSSPSLSSWYFRICLYPILERIGHPNPMLSGAGKLAMAHISEATKTPIPNVILSNSDYLTHHIVLKLRQSSGFSSPAPLHVLVAILELASPNILTNLEEAVESVVNYGFKYVNNQKAINCLKCILVFTKFVNKINPKEKKMEMKTAFDCETKCDSSSECLLAQGTGSVTQKIMKYLRCKRIENSLTDNEQDTIEESVENEEHVVDGDNNEAEDDDVMDEPPKPNLPKHVQLTVTVLKQILSMISSKDKERKLMAMEILSEGIWIIEGHADELLPLVHKIWSPLSVQFNDNDPLVMHHAFNLLSVLSMVAKDFIRDRTITKVLPSITKFLLKQSKSSLKKDSGSTYRFSQAYKLQLSILSGLGELALLLDFQEQGLSEILTATSPYLSSLQPQPLQDACVKIYKLLSRVDRNIVLLKLNFLGNFFKKLQPPSEEFKLYHVPNQFHNSQEYEKNVSLLVQYLYHGC